MDAFGNVIYDDNTTLVEIKPAEGTFVIGTSKQKAINGTVLFENLAFVG